MESLDFSRCRNVWVPDDSETGGFWNPPFEHVKIGVRKIVENPYLLLADDMGLSKTAQSIIAAQFLHDADVIDRVIVIAPAAVRSAVWFDPDLGQLKEQVFDDKLNMVSEYHARIRRWVNGPEDAKPLRWIVSNFEFVRDKRNLATLLQYCGPKTFLVLDESSAVRGYDSAQTEACMILRWQTNKKGRPILGMPRCGRILEMNGTPVAESPLDLFSQGNLLHPSILDCRYITHYKARYAVQVPVLSSHRKDENGKALPLKDRWNRDVMTIASGPEGWTNLDDLTRRFAPYVLRREAKSLGIDFALPPVGFDVALSEPTWRAYQDMKREMVAWLKSGVATAAQAGVKAIRLAQMCSGFVGGVEDAGFGDAPLLAPADGIEWIGREKLDFALELHAKWLKADPDLKLLTWCRFVPELKKYLQEEVKAFPSIPVGAACGQKVMNGIESQKAERERALRLLHPKTAPPGAATVGATSGTGAIGLNFTACRTVLDLSYDMSPWKKRQGDARVNRPGQTGPVSFFYLVATGPKGQRTIDHHTMLRRLGKMQINDLTVAGWVKMLEEE